MKITTLSAILHALNHAGVRYLIVGGVAVNLHGYQRLTADLDLVVQLQDKNLQACLKALNELGYRPSIPEPIEAFAQHEKRLDWINNKHMQVFQLYSDKYEDTSVDLFVSEPFDFDAEYSDAENIQLDKALHIKLIRIPALIEMKQKAGRERDIDDISHLRHIAEQDDEK